MKIGKIRRGIRKVNKMINYILLKTGIKDLYFYFYIWRFIMKNKKSQMWQDYNLRHDWIGRIYTVQSHSYEDALLPEEVKYTLVTEKIRPLVDWLQKNNLGEILMPDVKKIQDTYSYLIKFSPLFYEISVWWIISRSAIVYAAYYFYPYVKNLIDYATR